MAVSPYQLLVACKVPPEQPNWTPYDLYSATLSGLAPQEHRADNPSAPPPAVPSVQPRSSLPRTHYITDIKKRHAAAQMGCSACALSR